MEYTLFFDTNALLNLGENAFKEKFIISQKTLEEIENISKKEIREIHIVGGGSRDMYLNRLTGEITGKKIFIGLSEGTATGNIISQIMYHKKLTLAEGRKIIKDTFEITEVK